MEKLTCQREFSEIVDHLLHIANNQTSRPSFHLNSPFMQDIQELKRIIAHYGMEHRLPTNEKAAKLQEYLGALNTFHQFSPSWIRSHEYGVDLETIRLSIIEELMELWGKEGTLRLLGTPNAIATIISGLKSPNIQLVLPVVEDTNIGHTEFTENAEDAEYTEKSEEFIYRVQLALNSLNYYAGLFYIATGHLYTISSRQMIPWITKALRSNDQLLGILHSHYDLPWIASYAEKIGKMEEFYHFLGEICLTYAQMMRYILLLDSRLGGKWPKIDPPLDFLRIPSQSPITNPSQETPSPAPFLHPSPSSSSNISISTTIRALICDLRQILGNFAPLNSVTLALQTLVHNQYLPTTEWFQLSLPPNAPLLPISLRYLYIYQYISKGLEILPKIFKRVNLSDPSNEFAERDKLDQWKESDLAQEFKMLILRGFEYLEFYQKQFQDEKFLKTEEGEMLVERLPYFIFFTCFGAHILEEPSFLNRLSNLLSFILRPKSTSTYHYITTLYLTALCYYDSRHENFTRLEKTAHELIQHSSRLSFAVRDEWSTFLLGTLILISRNRLGNSEGLKSLNQKFLEVKPYLSTAMYQSIAKYLEDLQKMIIDTNKNPQIGENHILFKDCTIPFALKMKDPFALFLPNFFLCSRSTRYQHIRYIPFNLAKNALQ